MSTSNYDGEGAVLVPGALQGYRAWTVGVDSKLHAVSQRTLWPGSELTAVCMAAGGSSLGNLVHRPSSDQRPPMKDCQCGIYANHRPDINDYWRNASHNPWSMVLTENAQLPGVIEAWGKVRLGSLGFRTEHARIVAIAYRPLGPVRVLQATTNRGTVHNTDLETYHWRRGVYRWDDWNLRRQLPELRLDGVGESLAPVLVAVVLLDGLESPVQLRIELEREPTAPPTMDWATTTVHQAIANQEQQLAKNYPGVEIFHDINKMAAAFPPVSIEDLVDQDTGHLRAVGDPP